MAKGRWLLLRMVRLLYYRYTTAGWSMETNLPVP
jgi:hypothetical protein